MNDLAKVITSNLRQKYHSQLILIDKSLPCQYRMIRASRAKDSDYRSLDFVGVFRPKTSRSIIERELKYQGEL